MNWPTSVESTHSSSMKNPAYHSVVSLPILTRVRFGDLGVPSFADLNTSQGSLRCPPQQTIASHSVIAKAGNSLLLQPMETSG
jgi:hypothetical protein